MFSFILELLLSSICFTNYFLKFYFWLDLISILSMLLDIHWFYDVVIVALSNGTTQNNIIKSAKTTKIGTRAIRILRLVRLVRLVRIAKLFKASQNIKNPEKLEDESINKKIVETKVGKKLSELTMRKVIILVFSMILGVIFINQNFYYTQISVMEFGMKIFNSYNDVNQEGLIYSLLIFVSENDNVSF
jgi:hypothetical protein